MTLLLVTKNPGLKQRLMSLEVEVVPLYAAARASINQARGPYEAIIYDASDQLLGEKQIQPLIEASPLLIVWQAERDMAAEMYYLQSGASFYCSGEVSAPLMQLYFDRVLHRPTHDDAVSEEGVMRTEHSWLYINERRHEVRLGRFPVKLTVTEFLLFRALMERPGFVKTRDQLMDVAYAEQVYVEDRTIDSHIKRLRKKLRVATGLGDKIHKLIETKYCLGYVGRPEKVEGLFLEQPRLEAVPTVQAAE